MTEPSSERNPVEELAEEFLERFRQGERPAVSEYTQKYPDLADDIRELFPALVMLEDVRPAAASAHEAEREADAPGRQHLERLGDYRILREIGRGGMGVVYEAEQESLGRHVALKVLSTHVLLDSRQLQRFQREARSAARLHHTNIVPVFGVGEHDNLHYYVMQLIHGQGLDQVLDQLRLLRVRAGGDSGLVAGNAGDEGRPPEAAAPVHPARAVAQGLLTGVFALPGEAEAAMRTPLDRRGDRAEHAGGADEQTPVPGPRSGDGTISRSGVRLPGQGEKSTLSDSGRPYWHSVARIGIQVAEALAYAHGQGTLHRDIKPANLLLDMQAVVWVTDFGLAKASDSEDLTNTGDVVGTLRYMAPERFQGKADARSDVYALGLTLYELLTLRPAFGESERDKLLSRVMHEEPPRPRKLNPAVPRDLETIVCKAIARDPAHRYQTAADLAEDLSRFRDDRPIRARPVGEVERLLRWCRRNPAPAALTACLILSLLVGIVGTTLKWREAENERQNVAGAEREASRKRDEAVDARKDTQRVLAGAMLDKGIALAEQTQVGDGLFWMLEALKEAPDDSGDLARVIRTNLAGWLRQTPRLEQTMARTRGAAVSFTPDSKHLLVADAEQVECWDATAGRPCLRRLAKTGESAFALAFSPDGRRLVTRLDRETGPGAVKLWDISALNLLDPKGATGKSEPSVAVLRLMGSPLAHPLPARCAVFRTDGKQLLTGCDDGVARLWDCETGKLVRTFDFDRKGVWRVALSADGRMLAAVCLEVSKRAGFDLTTAAVYVAETSSGRRLAGPLAHRAEVSGLAFAPDGRTLVTAGPDGTARVWETAGGKPVAQPMRHSHGVQAVRFTPDGREILTGSEDGVVRAWDAATARRLAGTFAVSRVPVADLAISPDGGLLAVRRDAIETYQLDVCAFARDRSRPLARGEDPAARPDTMQTWWYRHFASHSPDGRLVLTGGSNGFAWMRVSATGAPAYLDVAGQENPFRHTSPAVDVTAFSPDGRRCATASRSAEGAGEARLWDAGNGRLVAVLPQVNFVAAMAFSPDGKVLATGGYDRHVHFWDAATGKRIGKPVFQGDIVIHLAFSHDGKKVVVSRTRDYSGKDTVAVYDVPTGQQAGALLPVASSLVSFTPNDKDLLTTTGFTIKRWDAVTGALRSTMTESGTVNTLVLHPNGTMLLAGGSDGTLRLRDLNSGAPVGAPMACDQGVNAAAFSPDPGGRLIVAGYGDGTARVWDRATQKPLGPPVVHSRPVLAVSFTADGRSFLTTDSAGYSRSWPVPEPVPEPVARLGPRLEIHTGLQMLEGQAVVPIAPAEWNRRRERFVTSWGEGPAGGGSGDPAPPSTSGYHEARLRDAEDDRVPHAALWHLERLLAAATAGEEKGWLYARRARVHVRMGRSAEADADFGRASAHIAAGPLGNWCRHGAAECLGDGQWAGAVWFLDRAVAAAPADWHLYADRALAQEMLGRAEARDADLARAVNQGADSAFLFRLVNDYAGRGLWDKATDTFAKAAARGPDVQAPVQWQALFSLRANQPARYRGLCEQVFRRIGPDPPAGLANAAAWLCALGPDAVADYRQAVALAESALNRAGAQERPSFLNTLGAVLYRAGRFREALARLEEGIRTRNDQGTAQDWVFMAMAHQRLGDADKARALLARVRQHQEKLAGRGWEFLELDVLGNEAQALLDGPHGKKK